MAIKLHGDLVIDSGQGIVVIEGDTVTDVNSTQAKAYALQVAKGRMNRPGISTQSGPYAINPKTGEAYDNPLQGLHPGTKFRQDFTLQEGI
jgi:isopentenyl phosphate kinase